MKFLGSLFSLLFGGAFAGFGVMVALATAVPTYQEWQAMQLWRPAHATLLQVSGSDNDTVASYRYTVDGIDYQNDRVYVASFKDNIGSYHQDLTRRLQRLKQNGQAVPIWYDPEAPGQAVIDRDMRWGLFALMSGFCSVFILIGLIVGVAGFRSGKQNRGARNRGSLRELRRQWLRQRSSGHRSESFVDYVHRQAAPSQQSAAPAERRPANDRPWLERKEWRQNRIRSNAKTGMCLMWFFAAAWCAVTSPILFVLEDELNGGNYAALLGLLFPLAGLWLLTKAWKLTVAWRRYGVIELQLDPFPGSIGGHVGGNLMLSNVSDFRGRYTVGLECIHSYVSGSGDNRSRRESVVWAEQGVANSEANGRGLRLEFRFDVPEGLPEAELDRQDAYYYWRLNLSAEIDGVPLNRQYDIPVFATGNRSRFVRHDISARADELRKEQALLSQAAVNSGDFSRTGLARAFVYRNDGGRHRFYYPMFRNKLLTLFSLIFAGGFDFAAYMINREFGGDGILGIGMLIFSLPFAAVGLLATIAAIYLPFNNLSVCLGDGKIKALRRLLFIPVRYNALGSRDVTQIEVKATGTSGQGVKQIEHFKLLAHGKNGCRFTIAEGIDGQQLAEQLKDFIGKRLGLEAGDAFLNR